MFERDEAGRRGGAFFSKLAIGVSLLAVTLVVCATFLAAYGLRVVERKSGDLGDLIGELAEALPGLVESLPPVLSDAARDAREPRYLAELEVEALPAPLSSEPGLFPAVLTVKNRGDRVVTLLGVRIVFVRGGIPVAEAFEWVATPLAGREEWRGPLFPGSERRLIARAETGPDAGSGVGLTVEAEVCELRVWTGDAQAPRGEVSVGDVPGAVVVPGSEPDAGSPASEEPPEPPEPAKDAS